MMLMESLVKQTLLYNTETWVNIKTAEMERVNRGHYLVLRKIFEQRESTPYYGILAETGYWPYSYVIIYKKIMYFHHLIHSNKRRIARRIVINQTEMDKTERRNNRYNGVEQWLKKMKN